jgi:hypothetical protein
LETLFVDKEYCGRRKRSGKAKRWDVFILGEKRYQVVRG